MKVKLEIEIECGKKTCAFQKGKFCKFFRHDMRGNCSCHLFGELYADLTGWTQRHKECLKHKLSVQPMAAAPVAQGWPRI